VRSIVGCSSIILANYALDRLSLADTTLIVYTSPVFVTLLAHLFLKEKAGWGSVLTIALALVGVFIIARPSILTGQSAVDHNTLVSADRPLTV